MPRVLLPAGKACSKQKAWNILHSFFNIAKAHPNIQPLDILKIEAFAEILLEYLKA